MNADRTMTAAEARAALEAMRERLSPLDSSEKLKRDVKYAIRLIDDGRHDEAIELIDHLAANVADSERMREMGRDPRAEEDVHPYWADESATEAYFTLSRVRFEWGFRGMGRTGSNVVIHRAGKRR